MPRSAQFELLRRGSDKDDHEDTITTPPARTPLHVGAAHDPAEAAADRVADEVLRKLGASGEGGRSAAGPSAGLSGIPRIGAGGGAAPDAVTDAIDQARAGGRPLDTAVRRRMEPAFGHSLGGVRIHDDSRAAQVASTLSADAFTVGSDIFFGAGQYRPGEAGGDHVLAHELAHTAQSGPVRRSVIHRKLSGTAEAMENLGGGRTSNKKRKFFGKPTNWDKILGGLGQYEDMEAKVVERPARLGQLRKPMGKSLRGVSASIRDWRSSNKQEETEQKVSQSRTGAMKHGDITDSDDRYKAERRQAIALVEPRVNNELKLLTDDDPGAWMRSLGLSPDKVAATGGKDSGQKNTVQELQYSTESGDMKGYFKKDIGFNATPEFHEMKTGITQHDPNYGARSVAMYRLDQLLKAGVTARAEFAVHKDDQGKSVLGTVLESAKGKAASKIDFGMDEEHAKRIGPGSVALDDPVLLRGLNKLQILDAIAGQLDRHQGNYYVDTGKDGKVKGVTGIDLDMAFGTEMTTPDHKSASSAHNYRGLPKVIDEEMGRVILSIDEKDIRDALTGLLGTGEVEATVKRFLAVKAAVKEAAEAGKLRNDWGSGAVMEHIEAKSLGFMSSRESYQDDVTDATMSQLKKQIGRALEEVQSGDVQSHGIDAKLLPDFGDLPKEVRIAYDAVCRKQSTSPIIEALAKFIVDHHVPGDQIAELIDAVIAALLNPRLFDKAMVGIQTNPAFRDVFTAEISDPTRAAIPAIWARINKGGRRQNRRARVGIGRGR